MPGIRLTPGTSKPLIILLKTAHFFVARSIDNFDG